ncbi:putative UDP-N-acetylglucosamine--peptide N-acetylglucosaminyltransferase SPINDLY-like [Salvia divinorum]|uniref:UDP-N-acetylglucosamine--peptide N-acetylglucosaminyltransferase SPINDLY-like n=1 Tax=Salvia divinorum TaxID=28513 RepID=A0ABD1HJ55_SALDI
MEAIGAFPPVHIYLGPCKRKWSSEVSVSSQDSLPKGWVLYRDAGKISLAVEAYEQCLNPDSRNAGQNRLLAMNYIHDGTDDKLYSLRPQKIVPFVDGTGFNEKLVK